MRRIVPSPPTATVSCALRLVDDRRRPRARRPLAPARPPCRLDARVRDDRDVSTGECCVDSLVEVIGKSRLLGMRRGGGRARGCPSGRGVRSLRLRRRSPASRARLRRPRGRPGGAPRRRARRRPCPTSSRPASNCGLTSTTACQPGAESAQHRRQRDADGDERDVADGELRRERELGERARVRPLEHDDARVGAQPRMELPVADVDRDHARRAALEQHVGEAAGRRADVEAVEARRIDAEARRARARASRRRARRTRGGASTSSSRVLVHLLARLVVAGHEPGEDERLRLRARLGEPALHEEDVQHASSRAVSARRTARHSRLGAACSIAPARLRGRSPQATCAASIARLFCSTGRTADHRRPARHRTSRFRPTTSPVRQLLRARRVARSGDISRWRRAQDRRGRCGRPAVASSELPEAAASRNRRHRGATGRPAPNRRRRRRIPPACHRLDAVEELALRLRTRR